MKHFRLALLVAAAAFSYSGAQAQTVSDFENLSLSKADTFYKNTQGPKTVDLGFTNGNAHFQYFWDTTWGGLWDHGFAYSNMTDSVTSGYTNMYSAKAAKGYNNSANYVVGWVSNYGSSATKINLTGAAAGKLVKGFYATNTTYAFNSMRDGDAYARQFGDTTGTGQGGTIAQGAYPDWFKLTVKAWYNGALKQNTVDFYLADFRAANSAQDYILKDWTWVDLESLGNVDSLMFELTSSDTAGGGMNTPSYFAMDNFTTADVALGVNAFSNMPKYLEVYPNPAVTDIRINTGSLKGNEVALALTDVAGKVVLQQNFTAADEQVLNMAQLHAGLYMLEVKTGNQRYIAKIVKQ
jgi:hypothetical protein